MTLLILGLQIPFFFFQTKVSVSIHKKMNWLYRLTKIIKEEYTYPSWCAASVISSGFTEYCPKLLFVALSWLLVHMKKVKRTSGRVDCGKYYARWVFWTILLKRCLNSLFPWQFHGCWEKACLKFGFAWARVVSGWLNGINKILQSLGCQLKVQMSAALLCVLKKG